MTGDGRRPARVAERIRDCLAQALQRDISDPRLSLVGITRVEVPPDLSTAIVYVRHFIGDTDEQARRGALRALRSAAGRLRHGLGPALAVRRVPELRFEYDTGPDATRRIDELLHEIETERGEPPSDS
jgi:ribosome-binding factor A